MSDKDWERGYRDGEHNSYNPPHERGVVGSLISSYSDKEIDDRKDYGSGFRAGKK